ncbi:MAG: tyrosine--tRNA ligase [Deltaproteobacteria bacterium CG_4_8_14_3_um_filter_51_11]|nr:tyrosine--tRNA ligase [bacterium]OIP37907.1 MAG: tyrosine--tRNA ligase [Desulfobacteraceae bacterium CG2_30_51_40]PIP47996.1 MAG: tyrosine--tRNA ligase [Deltaproteobacteria bacterium CG23_combo_of_CG06-09_8_20_14_all_51_20]PIW01026.1 MAG: tyrosine--tRNA ligase [Deltaproteobacteria bacterium CG17_big_fil_post_rev_8_21_14_2_50_51_6]PIX18637.1 MAG: tyrosine--tRNA ligase [Deltaproteobacteria bacterium CG_4_8_14_3_um_filter_51_11]PIY25221.1 MAG: tyrosine--tRNA ligase [Deltaproteobacteria bacteri
MENVFEIFEQRGFIEQVTDRTMLEDLLREPVTCYIGFDPTAKSLHAGSLLPIMSLMHMQRQGHRPIAIVGGGTALVGDPSGKTEMRPIMTRDQIDENAASIKAQLSRFLDFSDGKAFLVNNADWLTELSYIEFLRDIGKHFSVNRMLTAESYRTRLETGLNFIEFNYMLLQAYDFLHLFKHYGCRLQMGGNDQWGNILAGADLIRRLEGEIVHGLTLPLLTTSTGIKMGKTHKGAIWLDPELTSSYEYYQYWINQADADIKRFLALFTFLPMGEVKRLGALEGSELNHAKEILAFEATRICHGEKEAEKARNASRSLFGGGEGDVSSDTPTFSLDAGELAYGIEAFILFSNCGLCKTRAEARRLISQGGAYLNGIKVESAETRVNSDHLKNGAILLRAGKKRYMRILAKPEGVKE